MRERAGRNLRVGTAEPGALSLFPCPQVLEYNAVGGKYHRGLTVLIAFQELVEPRKQDADSLRRALTVGWCVELVRGGEAGEAETLQGGGVLRGGEG